MGGKAKAKAKDVGFKVSADAKKNSFKAKTKAATPVTFNPRSLTFLQSFVSNKTPSLKVSPFGTYDIIGHVTIGFNMVSYTW